MTKVGDVSSGEHLTGSPHCISDTTPPEITPAVSGTLGTNDWYTSDVTVSWTGSDPESRANTRPEPVVSL